MHKKTLLTQLIKSVLTEEEFIRMFSDPLILIQNINSDQIYALLCLMHQICLIQDMLKLALI